MANAGGTGANPVITGIIGAVLGGALVAGGFLAFGGDESEPPTAREFAQNQASKADDEDAREVVSGLKLGYREGRFGVKVTAARDFCINGRKVIIFEEKRRGDPERVAALTTNDAGVATSKLKADGTYFARMPESEAAAYGKKVVCLPAISPDVKV